MRDWRKKAFTKIYKNVETHLSRSLQMFFFSQEKCFLLLNLTAMHFPTHATTFRKNNSFAKAIYPLKIYQIIRSEKGGVNVDGLDAIYEPGGVNKFQPIKNFTHYEWVKKKLNEKFIFTRDESGNCCFCRKQMDPSRRCFFQKYFFFVQQMFLLEAMQGMLCIQGGL